MNHLPRTLGVVALLFLVLSGCTSPVPTITPPPPTRVAPTQSPPPPPPAPTLLPTPRSLTATQLAQLGKGMASRVAYSPDGTMLAVAGSVGLHLYDASTLEELCYIETAHPLVGVAFSCDSRLLGAKDSVDGSAVQIWDAASGQPVPAPTGAEGQMLGLTLGPNNLLATCGEGMVPLAEADLSQLLSTIGGERTYARFSPDRSMLATWDSTTGKILLWDVKTGQVRYRFEGNQAVFRPDGAVVATQNEGYSQMDIRFWDTASGQLLLSIPQTRYANDMAFSPDGKALAVAGRQAALWDAATGQLLHAFGEPTSAVEFSSDGRTLATVDNDYVVRLWNVAGGELSAELPGYTEMMFSVAFSPDGRLLAAGNGDGSAYLWDVASLRAGAPQLLNRLGSYTSSVDSLAFSLDSHALAIGPSYDDAATLWDTGSGGLLASFPGHERGVSALAYSPDGRVLATSDWGRGGRIRLWDPGTGQLLQTLEQGNIVPSLAFSPNGQLLAAGGSLPDTTGSGYEYVTQLWDLDTGQVLRTLRGHENSIYDVAFSPDGHTLVTGSPDQTVRFWEVSAGQPGRILTDFRDAVVTIALSPDGRLLASGDNAGEVRVWDVATGQLLLTLFHADRLYAVDFSPDGQLLASASHDGTVKVWQLGGVGSRESLSVLFQKCSLHPLINGLIKSFEEHSSSSDSFTRIVHVLV